MTVLSPENESGSARVNDAPSRRASIRSASAWISGSSGIVGPSVVPGHGVTNRALKHRLGLTHRPEQLRVLAASASLDPARDASYLQDFFGLPAETFEFKAMSTAEAIEVAMRFVMLGKCTVRPIS